MRYKATRVAVTVAGIEAGVWSACTKFDFAPADFPAEPRFQFVGNYRRAPDIIDIGATAEAIYFRAGRVLAIIHAAREMILSPPHSFVRSYFILQIYFSPSRLFISLARAGARFGHDEREYATHLPPRHATAEIIWRHVGFISHTAA